MTEVRLLDAIGWRTLARGDDTLIFCGLFVSQNRVYALFDAAGTPHLAATELAERSYPSIAPGFPAAAWFERLAHDLTGAVALGAADTRPAITHGAPGTDAAWPRFIETAAAGAYQIGAGPVAGIIASPVHRRFTMAGAQVLRLEHRLGYAHRGIAALMRGKSPRAAARFAARITGDATVAHAVAFARAAEAIAGEAAPARAGALREAMLAIERITTDLAALAATMGEAGDARFAALLGRAREDLAAAAGEVFGHRLMMDIVIPGGVAVDARAPGIDPLRRVLAQAARVVRAIGWGRVRRDLGNAAALAEARARSVIGLAGTAIERIEAAPAGIIAQALPITTGMAVGSAASARGMVHHWLDLESGQIRDCFAIDPSARLLAVLEASVAGQGFEAASVLTACYGLSVSAIDG